MKYILCMAFAFAGITATAQQDLSTLSDEFNDSSSIHKWQFAHQAEGFPSKVKNYSINNGMLHLEPGASGWYADYQAPFLFQEIQGNFDVRMKIKVSGKNGALPTADWSLAGLMVRQPRKGTPDTWRARLENWLFLTTGVAHQLNLPVFETKSTNNSLSNLKLRPAQTGWIEMRIVHIDAAFILMAKYENEKWQVLERFYRPLLQGPLQVGVNAYSGWETIPQDLKNNPKAFNETAAATFSDLLVEVDYIRFKKPAINLSIVKPDPAYSSTLFYTPGNLLTDFSISNETLLSVLGE